MYQVGRGLGINYETGRGLGALGATTLSASYVPKWSDYEIQKVVAGTDPNTNAPRPFNAAEYSQALVDAVRAEASKRGIAIPQTVQAPVEPGTPPAVKKTGMKMSTILLLSVPLVLVAGIMLFGGRR